MEYNAETVEVYGMAEGQADFFMLNPTDQGIAMTVWFSPSSFYFLNLRRAFGATDGGADHPRWRSILVFTTALALGSSVRPVFLQ